SFVCVHLYVVEINFGEAVAEDARCSLSIRNWIDAFHHPCSRLRFVCRPRFAASTSLSIGQIRDFQFETVPRVWLPGIRDTLCAFNLRLPRLEMQHLAVAVESQYVTLRDYTGIALLPALLRRQNIAFYGVV